MSKQSERTQFVQILADESKNPEAPTIALELITRARKAHRYAETACNGELTPRQEKMEAANDTRIRQLVADLGPAFRALISGDPRGYVVKIKLPSGRSNNWGGEGWGVPD